MTTGSMWDELIFGVERRTPENLCVYGLVDPDDECVRYVGITGADETGDVRLLHHLDAARKGARAPVYDWIRGLVAAGAKPELVVLELAPLDGWEAYEDKWIQHYGGYAGAGGNLFNVRPGGGGAPRGTAQAQSLEARWRDKRFVGYTFQGTTYRRLTDVTWACFFEKLGVSIDETWYGDGWWHFDYAYAARFPWEGWQARDWEHINAAKAVGLPVVRLHHATQPRHTFTWSGYEVDGYELLLLPGRGVAYVADADVPGWLQAGAVRSGTEPVVRAPARMTYA